MTSRKTALALAGAFALLALAPLAQAAATDDHLTQTFPYISGVRAEVGGDGIGWYDAANPPNVCLISLLGVQTPIGGLFYYDTLRTAINFAGTGGAVIPLPSTSVAVACPAVLNPACLVGCGIYVEPITIAPAVRTLLPVDSTICNQHSSFITCILSPATATLDVKTCGPAAASFSARAAASTKGVLGGTGLANVVLSQQLNCAWATTTNYNGLLNDFTATTFGTGFDGVVLAAHVAPGVGGDNSAYVAVCTSAGHSEIDTSVVPPVVTSPPADNGQDWVLGLDTDGAANWAGHLLGHVGQDPVGGQLLRGLGDLGAANGC